MIPSFLLFFGLDAIVLVPSRVIGSEGIPSPFSPLLIISNKYAKLLIKDGRGTPEDVNPRHPKN